MVRGKHLYLRDICEEDARFVFDLRTNQSRSKYLSPVSGRLEDQVNWIRSYRLTSNQAYFIVCDGGGERLGCIRMYDPDKASYCWGSWLMVEGLGPVQAVESALLVYAYGKLEGFTSARIDVRRENVDVWKFHERFAMARLLKEDEVNRYYEVEGSSIDGLLRRYSSLLTAPLEVAYA